MDKYINAPISDEDIKELKAGDYVYITGTIYTGAMRHIKEWQKHLQTEKNFQ